MPIRRQSMELTLQPSKCKTCGALLLEPGNSVRTPCPVCSGMSRVFEENIKETIVVGDHMRMKGKHGGKGKPFFDAQVGASFYFKTQTWHHLERIIDRDNDLYIEIIKNPKTGEIISRVEEPLSQHKGHGSAKYKIRK